MARKRSSTLPVTDHLGNRYCTTKEMAQAWGIPDPTFRARIQRHGWDLEKALTTPVYDAKEASGKRCLDHLGKEYISWKALAEAYGIPYNTLRGRLRLGWSLEKSLTTPITESNGPRPVTDHTGETHPSIRAMAREHGVSYSVYKRRVKDGWSVEKALTKPVLHSERHPVTDHTGKSYDSLAAMARAYGLTHGTLSARLRNGWDLERALTTPVGPYNRKR